MQTGRLRYEGTPPPGQATGWPASPTRGGAELLESAKVLPPIQLPGASDVIVAELGGIARPRWGGLEHAPMIEARSRIAGLILVRNAGYPGIAHPPSPMGLGLGPGGHDHGHRHPPGRVIVIIMPGGTFRPALGQSTHQVLMQPGMIAPHNAPT